MVLPLDPKLAKELAEERQRELLEEVEADKLAEGDIPANEFPGANYKPVTDSDEDIVPPRRTNRHVHKEEQ